MLDHSTAAVCAFAVLLDSVEREDFFLGCRRNFEAISEISNVICFRKCALTQCNLAACAYAHQILNLLGIATHSKIKTVIFSKL